MHVNGIQGSKALPENMNGETVKYLPSPTTLSFLENILQTHSRYRLPVRGRYSGFDGFEPTDTIGYLSGGDIVALMGLNPQTL